MSDPISYVARVLSSGISETLWTGVNLAPAIGILSSLCMDGEIEEPGLYLVATPEKDTLNAHTLLVKRAGSGWSVTRYHPEPRPTDVAHWPPRQR